MRNKIFLLVVGFFIFLPLLNVNIHAKEDIKDIIGDIDITECDGKKIEKSLFLKRGSQLGKCYQFENNSTDSITLTVYFTDSFVQNDGNIGCRNQNDNKSSFVDDIQILNEFNDKNMQYIEYNIKPKEVLKTNVKYKIPNDSELGKVHNYCFVTDFGKMPESNMEEFHLQNQGTEEIITGNFNINFRKAKVLNMKVISDELYDANMVQSKAHLKEVKEIKTTGVGNNTILLFLIFQILLLLLVLFFYFKDKKPSHSNSKRNAEK